MISLIGSCAGNCLLASGTPRTALFGRAAHAVSVDCPLESNRPLLSFGQKRDAVAIDLAGERARLPFHVESAIQFRTILPNGKRSVAIAAFSLPRELPCTRDVGRPGVGYGLILGNQARGNPQDCDEDS